MIPRHATPDPLREVQQAIWDGMLREAAALASLYRGLCLPQGIEPTPKMCLQAFTLLEAFGDLTGSQPPPVEAVSAGEHEAGA